MTLLPIALRAYAIRSGSLGKKKRKKKSKKPIPYTWPDSVLIFDTETTPDATQRLL